MVRLDSMSKEELYALRSKSRILLVLGNIKMIGFYFILFIFIIGGCTAIFAKQAEVLFLLPVIIIFFWKRVSGWCKLINKLFEETLEPVYTLTTL